MNASGSLKNTAVEQLLWMFVAGLDYTYKHVCNFVFKRLVQDIWWNIMWAERHKLDLYMYEHAKISNT